MTDLWLPSGYQLSNATEVSRLRYSGDSWQIYETRHTDNILLTQVDLAQGWIEAGLLTDVQLDDIEFGQSKFKVLSSNKANILCSVENNQATATKATALAFALALRESRCLLEEVSFHDAIYVEQYSRLLPTWTVSPSVDDDVVLGRWITGGVMVSTNSFRRLTNLTGTISPIDLTDVIEAAGFAVPRDADQLVKRNPTAIINDKMTDLPAKKRAREKQSSDVADKAQDKVFKLPGRPQLELFFNEHVIDIIFNAEQYQALGIDFPSAVVLQGPPGCGKTFAVERLVEFLDWPSFSIDSNSVGSPFIHETSKKISGVFDQAIDNAPSILVIDEMESFLSDRRSGPSSGLHHVEEVAEFLRRIPEAIENRVLIIAMTNMIDMIDPAIIRRGRFDHIVEVGMPSREEVASLIDSLLGKLPKSNNLKLSMIIDELAGRALSDSAFVIREGARLAAKSGKSQIDQACLEKALSSLPQIESKQSIGFIKEE